MITRSFPPCRTTLKLSTTGNPLIQVFCFLLFFVLKSLKTNVSNKCHWEKKSNKVFPFRVNKNHNVIWNAKTNEVLKSLKSRKKKLWILLQNYLIYLILIIQKMLQSFSSFSVRILVCFRFNMFYSLLGIEEDFSFFWELLAT